ncbi:uncharacterized protein LOC141702881 [Apium graveolens]|uniref:uncharacterized protein LOC141702881 n=1 Tax=Apium graveolens TaxID=4045 RepID=UPI003D794B28
MDKYVIQDTGNASSSEPHNVNIGESSSKRPCTEINVPSDDIIGNPALRKPINSYDPRIQDDVRRKYVLTGPCQPITHTFPKILCGDKDRGFRNWKKANEKFKNHVGKEGSIHRNAQTLYLAFKDQRQSVTRRFSTGTENIGAAYRARLIASVDVARLLLGLGLAFRRQDESLSSIYRGNFLEILSWYSLRNPDVGKVVKDNAPANHQITAPSIQKQIVNACASETTKAIICDIGDKFFSLLLDEARDNSVKEQMAIVLRYVNKLGEVVEQFFGVVHVKDTTTFSLKDDVDNFFAMHGLSISKVRGQGYDGASNMRGELNGLKTLILNENPYARYIHCFSHQLQLVVMTIAEGNQFISDFFDYLSLITNAVGASCKRKDELRQK